MEGPLTRSGYGGYPSDGWLVGWGRPQPEHRFIRMALLMFDCTIVNNFKFGFVSPGAEGFYFTCMRRRGAIECLLCITCRGIQSK